jgi:hypothetical protein
LEDLLEKDRAELNQIYGAVENLESLKGALNQTLYDGKMQVLLQRLSQWLSYNVTTEAEMHFILNFFHSTQEMSLADKVKAAFTIANVLMILAIIVSVIAFGAVATIFIFPLVEKMPTIVKIMGLYVIATSITASAFFLPPYISSYIAFFGALCLGGAYAYNLSTCPPHEQIPAAIFLPPMLVWGSLAIVFHSQLIGFITIMAFASSIGFSVWTGPLCTAIGFQKDADIPRAIVPSACLLAIYIAKTLGAFNAIAYYFEPFNTGVFFVGTFVYFTALLILSSRFFHSEAFWYYNILTVLSGLVVVVVGFLLPTFSIFRGVGITFMVIYLMQKYIEIPWEGCWSCGLLGGGLLLLGVGYLLKTFWAFIFVANI